MRGELMYKILNTIEDGVTDLINSQVTIISAGYGASLNRIEYENNLKKRKSILNRLNRTKSQESKLRLQKYLYKLKKDGLLVQDGAKFFLTKDGKKRLTIMKTKMLMDIPKMVSPNLIIFSYDLPVSSRVLRDRVREILKILDFKMIHQSLWVGKIKISKELLKYLEEIEALKYIEILEVTKQGTLSSIK
ncbi:MAG: hypothetical protein AAB636_02525 [Patescibacteria group bacterium]